MKKSFRLAAAVAAFGLALAFAACSNSSDGSAALAALAALGGGGSGGSSAVTYPVTIPTTFENGTIVADIANPTEGQIVTLTAKPADGYKIDTLTVKGADGSTIATSGEGNIRTFTMPGQSVTVSATFVVVPPTIYDVTLPALFENGTLAADITNPKEGQTITLTATPATDYKLGTVTVTGANGSPVTVSGTGNTRQFTMPAQNVTIAATFVSAIPAGFVKVAGKTVSGAVSGSSVFITNRSVTIPTMYACDHEVTQGEYETYCKYGSNAPSEPVGKGADWPAYYVNWYDAVVYCNLRSKAEDLTPVYAIGTETDPTKWSGIVKEGQNENAKYCGPSSGNDTWNSIKFNTAANGYRLPTEAEWEYLAREGSKLSTFNYSGSNDYGQVAWWQGNSDGKTHQVKTKAANDISLFDMSGNVWEWCWDWGSDTNISASTPSSGPTTGTKRVIRGGGYSYNYPRCSVYDRDKEVPHNPTTYKGFRVVCTVAQ